ncbi:MAG TPA: UDP-N-acetylglucosamine 2-epimerase (non-hydrolyzing) [Vicinamibacterales bacterium]|nr:UDP-N-acetylglucosamine 2-epimerase (non-hydrolyzing) [Vicinamibacterales bacterium]
MRIVSVVGARPQFIKAAPLLRELARTHQSVLIHTGQHYDRGMSAVFFAELGLPEPDHHLGVGSGPHGAQTAAMLDRIDPVLAESRPDWVVVFGDTNSTLAGALAASKRCLKLAHVEAGLRSFNRAMPEEINREIADHLADARFCPSDAAAANLSREGIDSGVYVVGDLMAQSLASTIARARADSTVLDRCGAAAGRFVLLTLHRAGTADDAGIVGRVVAAAAAHGDTVVFPVHPRTRRVLNGADVPDNVRLIEPVGYLEMLQLEASARLVLTDSGGVQKEAYWLGTPCITLREETEWTETVDAGWNRLAGTDPARIVDTMRTFAPPARRPPLYDGGDVARRIVTIIQDATGHTA